MPKVLKIIEYLFKTYGYFTRILPLSLALIKVLYISVNFHENISKMLSSYMTDTRNKQNHYFQCLLFNGP